MSALKGPLKSPMVNIPDLHANFHGRPQNVKLGMKSQPNPSRQEVVSALKNQTVIIPDLHAIFHGWPQNVNAELATNRKNVDERLESLFAGDSRLPILKAADFGLFGSSWWPEAGVDELKIVTFLAIWLFVWDDELDSEVGALASDFTQSQIFRAETTKYLSYCLGFEGENECREEPSNPIISSFKVIADAVRKVYTRDQLEAFLNNLKFYMRTSEIEQKTRLSNSLPTIEDYWSCRMGTSAVDACVDLNEFSKKIFVPRSIMMDADMKTLWDKANEIVWIVNDILSIKKELDQGTMDSLIPLLYLRHGNIQSAMNSAADMLRDAVGDFDTMAAQLFSRYQHEESFASLESFVTACRYNCTGNLNWSLATKRYGVCKESLKGGAFVTL